MSYYVESDGDRVPKDVYLCHPDEGRVLTMESPKENRRFALARLICSLLNGREGETRSWLQKQAPDGGFVDWVGFPVGWSPEQVLEELKGHRAAFPHDTYRAIIRMDVEIPEEVK